MTLIAVTTIHIRCVFCKYMVSFSSSFLNLPIYLIKKNSLVICAYINAKKNSVEIIRGKLFRIKKLSILIDIRPITISIIG